MISLMPVKCRQCGKYQMIETSDPHISVDRKAVLIGWIRTGPSTWRCRVCDEKRREELPQIEE